MTIKYLYVIQACGVNAGLNTRIIEVDCDCPLDSRILGQLESDTRKKYTSWTKLEDMSEYIGIQDAIQNVIKSDTKKYVGPSRLEYDFVNWGK